jgi:hypothetical protein
MDAIERADDDLVVDPHTRTPSPRHEDIRMDAQADMPAQSSPPKGKTTKKPKGKPAVDPKKKSLNLSISVDTHERLALHALRMTDGNISALVERLAEQHLREYHITRTPTRTGEPDAA